jgi:hypothetical protein
VRSNRKKKKGYIEYQHVYVHTITPKPDFPTFAATHKHTTLASLLFSPELLHGALSERAAVKSQFRSTTQVRFLSNFSLFFLSIRRFNFEELRRRKKSFFASKRAKNIKKKILKKISVHKSASKN